MIRIIGKREITEIALMFLIVQVVGLALIFLIKQDAMLAILKSQIVSPNSVFLSYVLDVLLVGILSLLLLNRHRRQIIVTHDKNAHKKDKNGMHLSHIHLEDNIIYGLLEAVVVIATSFFFFVVVFDLLIPQILSAEIFFLALGASIFLIAAKELDPKIRNVVTMVSSIGVGMLFGLYFNFEYALIALSVVAVYDYLAVFVTKTMIKIAKAVTNKDMAMMISSEHIESVPISSFPAKEVKEYNEYLKKTHQDQDEEYGKILRLGKLPVMSQIQLGEGDLGLPLMATIAAFLSYPSYFVSIAVIVGGMIGLFAAIRILRKYRHPLPAIPPLFAFISITSGIALAFTSSIMNYNPVILIIIGFAVASFGMVVRYVEHKEKIDDKSTQKTAAPLLLERIP